MTVITSKDFAIHKCNDQEWYYFISERNPEQIIQQILDDQEKAEKLDELIQYFCCDTFEDMFNLLKTSRHQAFDTMIERDNFKQIVEKIQELSESQEAKEHFFLCAGHCCGKYYEVTLQTFLENILKDCKEES